MSKGVLWVGMARYGRFQSGLWPKDLHLYRKAYATCRVSAQFPTRFLTQNHIIFVLGLRPINTLEAQMAVQCMNLLFNMKTQNGANVMVNIWWASAPDYRYLLRLIRSSLMTHYLKQGAQVHCCYSIKPDAAGCITSGIPGHISLMQTTDNK